jgi:membrane associated rhomboid family serine protease
MSFDTTDYEMLAGVERSRDVPRLDWILTRAKIPYQTAVVAQPRPAVVFLVPRSRLAEARKLVDARGRRAGGDRDEPARFPWGPVQGVAGLILVHLAVVFTLVGPDPVAADLAAVGGLIAGLTASQPWRLVTSLFVHSGPSHALWNGLSMMVFAVPLIGTVGYARTGGVYLAAGIVGGIAASSMAPQGVVIVGSSGAVAGLFGAWLALNLVRSRRHAPTRRALVRVIGVGLLVLPSFISPTTSTGGSVSLESHLGGLIFGLAAGIWLGLRTPPEDLPEDDEDEDSPEDEPVH